MGSGPSSSKADAGQSSSKRKFQSYHLPFVDQRQDKGFSKLRKALPWRRKKKTLSKPSTRYDTALALLSTAATKSSAASTPIVYGDAAKPVGGAGHVGELPPLDLHGLDYQWYYRSLGAGSALVQPSPLFHMSLVDGITRAEDEGDVDDAQGDALSLPDEQLMSSTIHDAYSEVIRRAIAAKSSGPAAAVLRHGGSLQNVGPGRSHPDELVPGNNGESSVGAGRDFNGGLADPCVVREDLPVVAPTESALSSDGLDDNEIAVRAPKDKPVDCWQGAPPVPVILSGAGSPDVCGSPSPGRARSRAVLVSAAPPSVARMPEVRCLAAPVPAEVSSSAAEAVDRQLPPERCPSAVPSGSAPVVGPPEQWPSMAMKDMPATVTAPSKPLPVIPTHSVSGVTDGENASGAAAHPESPVGLAAAGGPALPDSLPTVDDEGEALLMDIALKERHICQKLDEVKSSLTNALSGRISYGGSSSERSGSVGEEDEAALCGSQSSDVAVSGMSSLDSPWEDVDRAACATVADAVQERGSPRAAAAAGAETHPLAVEPCVGGLSAPGTTGTGVEATGGAWDDRWTSGAARDVIFSADDQNCLVSSGVLSDVGARVVRRSSSSSPPSRGKRFSEVSSGDGGGGDDDLGDDGRPQGMQPRNAHDIRSKLVGDLLTKLEVDLGDFQEFLTVRARPEEKYHLLPIAAFLADGAKVGLSVDELSRALRVLAKYGLNLLKPEAERPKYWMRIVVASDAATPPWLLLPGSRDVLVQLGYREGAHGFVHDDDAPRAAVAQWLIEMLLAAYELNACSLGSHPMAHLFRVGGGAEQRQESARSDDVRLWGPVERQQPTSSPHVYENTHSADAPFPQTAEGAAEPASMFGRRTVVPWLTATPTEKESRVAKDGVVQCGLCGSSSPAVRCERCSNQTFCLSCDDMYHRHPKRHSHVRKVVNAPPPPPPRPPPKPTDPNKLPVPPPRRRKSQHSTPPSPVFERRPAAAAAEQKPDLPKKQFPLKFGSLKRFMPMNRSAPTSQKQSPSPRSAPGAWPPPPDVPRHASSFSDVAPADSPPRSVDGPFGHHPNACHPSHGQVEGRFGYFDQTSNMAADPSSSDADEELSGRGSRRGSSSLHGDDWSRPVPPAFGGGGSGMTEPPHSAMNHGYPGPPPPNHGYATLSRCNTAMMGTVGRASPFRFGVRAQHQQRQSNSVWDLSQQHPHVVNPSAYAGYPLPQVQSMADLHCGDVDGLLPLSAPCGCRPSWAGPDSFGMWHPPARCVLHGSATSLYPGDAAMLKYGPGPQYGFGCASDGTVHPHLHPAFYPVVAAAPPPPHPSNFPSPPAPPPPPPPPRTANGTVAEHRPASPAAGARPSEPRRRSSKGSANDAAAAEGGTRTVRPRHAARPAKAGAVSESSEDDYYSADTSDEEKEAGEGGLLPPGRSWECEHCTFLNAADTRICSMCCKTANGGRAVRSAERRRRQQQHSAAAAAEGPRRNSARNGHAKHVRCVKDDGIYEDMPDVKPLPPPPSSTAAAADDVQVLSGILEMNLCVNDGLKAEPPTISSATARVEVLGTAQEKKKSTEQGPPEAAVAAAAPSVEPRKEPSRNAVVPSGIGAEADASSRKADEPAHVKVEHKTVISTGTSPPPQSISTQTPNDPVWTGDAAQPHPELSAGPIRRSSSRLSLSEEIPDTMAPPSNSSFSAAAAVLKRATSLHFNSGRGGSDDSPWSRNPIYRTGSRTSLMSDHPFGYSSGPPSRDASPPRSFLSRRDSERSYPGYSRFGHHEDRGFYPRSGSRKDYYLSLEELVERRRQETMRTQGLELVRLLREAELHSFTADDLQVAMNHCGSQNPVQWLHDNWKSMVDTVVTLATNYGHDKQENDVGIVSSAESKEALRVHKGNIWAAVTECVEQRQKKFAEIQSRGHFSKEEVIAALTANQGGLDAALNDLNKSTLKPFLMRIWGPPVGADNEAGAVSVGPSSRPRGSGGGDIRDYMTEHEKSPSSHDIYENYSLDGSDELLFSDGNIDDDMVGEEMIDYDDDDDDKAAEGDELQDVQANVIASEKTESWRPSSLKDDVFYDAIPASPDDGLAAIPRSPEVVVRHNSTDGPMVDPVSERPVSVAASASSPDLSSARPDLAARRSPAERETSVQAVGGGGGEQCLLHQAAPDTVSPCIPGSGAAAEPPDVRDPALHGRSAGRSARRPLAKRVELKIVLDTEFDRRVRQLLAEGKLATYEKAEVAVKLLDLKFDESEAVYAASECSDLYMAVSYLQQDCDLCAGKFPVRKMVSMLFCTHRCCLSCARDYFTLKIKERNIVEAVCPFCDQPDLTDDAVVTDYFNNLDILLKNLVDHDVHELFQCKLRDRALMSDPNFHWCAKCASGFIAEPNQRRLVCPDCHTVTCALCKKPWERQHDGISCEQFAAWKEANDPEYQAVGLEKYLSENGIDCPKCKCKYALAKGGCMHFTCSQCKYEFCSGCGKPFRMSKNCKVSYHCEKLGLHAHHPRNCLFYLRDKDPEELQQLLDDSDIRYDRDAPCAEGGSKKCTVMEQKELPNGTEDAICGREIQEEHAGLCRLHYVEYLVSLVNKFHVDPAYVMDVGGLQQELRRAEKPVPEQGPRESDDDYQERLVELILREIPLTD